MLKLRACPQCGGDLVHDAIPESLLDQRTRDEFTCLQCGCSVAGREAHPSAEQLEALAFGWLPRSLEQRIRAHTVNCATCQPRLAAEEAVRDQLALLGADELEVDLTAAWTDEPRR